MHLPNNRVSFYNLRMVHDFNGPVELFSVKGRAHKSKKKYLRSRKSSSLHASQACIPDISGCKYITRCTQYAGVTCVLGRQRKTPSKRPPNEEYYEEMQMSGLRVKELLEGVGQAFAWPLFHPTEQYGSISRVWQNLQFLKHHFAPAGAHKASPLSNGMLAKTAHAKKHLGQLVWIRSLLVWLLYVLCIYFNVSKVWGGHLIATWVRGRYFEVGFFQPRVC